MSYKVFADGTLIWASDFPEYTITKGLITKEVNKSGSFVFTMYQNNPFYDRLQKLKTIITVYRDNKLEFRGRIITSVDGFYNDKTFTCEGELSFLLDSVQRPYQFTGSPSDLFKQYIENHNAQVGPEKQFTVGQITVEDGNDYINRSNSAYEDTLSNINSRLLTESLGGYIYVTSGETDEERVINWFADFPYLSTQSIEFGENLLDFTKTNSAENLATAIIPLGARIETDAGGMVPTDDSSGDDEEIDDSTSTTDTTTTTGETLEQRVTIESVNGGVDYVYDEDAVNTYGWIFKSVTWDDVTEPANLLTKAKTYLNESINLNISLQLSALDLSSMDKDITAFELGDYIQVTSKPHGVDAKYLLMQQSIDLLAPENDKVTLGYTFSTFTDQTLGNTNTGTSINQKVENVISNFVPNVVLENEVQSLTSMIEQVSDSITMGVLESYTTNDDLVAAMGTLYTQLKDSFEFSFTTLETAVNESDANTRQEFEEIRKYIRFQDGDVIIGQSDNELRLHIENDQITFYDNAEELAYLSNHTLYITNAEVLTSMAIGNYAFLPRANGNLSFKKVR